MTNRPATEKNGSLIFRYFFPCLLETFLAIKTLPNILRCDNKISLDWRFQVSYEFFRAVVYKQRYFTIWRQMLIGNLFDFGQWMSLISKQSFRRQHNFFPWKHPDRIKIYCLTKADDLQFKIRWIFLTFLNCRIKEITLGILRENKNSLIETPNWRKT